LVGHHSERSHRRDLERMDRYLGKYMELKEEAEHHLERAKYYRGLASEGEDAEKVFRRIKKLEADVRKWSRELMWIEIEKRKGKGYLRKFGIYTGDEDRVRRALKRMMERLQAEKEKFKALTGKTFEEAVRERRKERRRGRKVELPFELKVGDTVSTPFGEARVVKINPKTVVVEKSGVRLKVLKTEIGRANRD